MNNEIKIKHILEVFNKHKVDFLPNFGNIGDTLIYASTKKLFNEHQIDYSIVSDYKKANSDVLFVCGGGALIDKYYTLHRSINEIYKNYNEIIILPSTIDGINSKHLFNIAGKKLKICCREKKTYGFMMQNFLYKENIFLCEDLAMSYDFSNYIDIGYGHLNSFRVDRERTNIEYPLSNIDLSIELYLEHKPYRVDYWNISYWNEYLDLFLNSIAKYRTISTNRLHIAIAAVKMNKEVKLFPNSYFKNKAVYEYSLSKYENIKWINKRNTFFWDRYI